MIETIKKWFATIFTSLVVMILFGITFIALDIVDPTSDFELEFAIVTIAVILIRIFWYNNGEEKAAKEQDIIDAQNNYSELVGNTITDQEHFELFLDDLNQQNRDNWVKNRLGNKTKKNCKNYDKIKDRLDRNVGFWVRPITVSQVLTRSSRYTVITAKDYKKRNKVIYQSSTLILSIVFTAATSAIVFKDFIFEWSKIVKFATYMMNIVWAMMSSLNAGYRQHREEVMDHVSRLTMIVNRYDDWRTNKGELEKCQSGQLQNGKTIWNDQPQNEQELKIEKISLETNIVDNIVQQPTL